MSVKRRRLREPPADSERMSKGGRIENVIYENKEIKDFLDLKKDEIYYFSYAEDLDEINKKIENKISFYGSGTLIEYSRIFVNDALVSLEYEPTYTLYGIVVKMNKNDFNHLYNYENNYYEVKSKIVEKNIGCTLYNHITNKVENHTLQVSTFMKIGVNEELKLKRMPTIEEMLKIRNMLNLRHKMNPYIYGSRLYVKGYHFLNEKDFDIYLYGIFRGNCEIEITKNI